MVANTTHIARCSTISMRSTRSSIRSRVDHKGVALVASRTQRICQVHRRSSRDLVVVTGGNGSAEDNHDTLRVDLSHWPDVQFVRVEAIVRPWRLQDVVHELSAHGILGMTATQVMGVGVQGGTRERYGGTEHGVENMVEKTKLEVVCFRDQVNAVTRIICGAARTGEIGDGKIFILPVADVVRIRTGETGAIAERMAGGMSDRAESDSEAE